MDRDDIEDYLTERISKPLLAAMRAFTDQLPLDIAVSTILASAALTISMREGLSLRHCYDLISETAINDAAIDEPLN